MKPIKPLKKAHTSNSSRAQPDYYGSGIRNKIGKPREIMGMKPLGSKKVGKPPKSLA